MSGGPFLQSLVLAGQQPQLIKILGEGFPDRHLLFQAHSGQSLSIYLVIFRLVAQAFEIVFSFVGQQDTHGLLLLMELPRQRFVADTRGFQHIAQRQLDFTMASYPG
jgi:hypothetical protein